jgi:hypothetical protein
VADGEILVFIDADVLVHADTLTGLESTFANDRNVDAVFGSYDTNPTAPNFISHYKNLFHHYVHHSSREQASTFWSGCGAIRKSVFTSMGGFDPSFTRPTVEDIELGIRLHRAGHRIVLNKQVEVTHAKSWSLRSLIISDICDRAVPWTQLILREKSLPDDLNLTWAQRISALMACGLFAVFAAGALRHPLLLLVPLLLLTLVLIVDYWSWRGRIPTWARWVGMIVMLATLGLAGSLMDELALISILLVAGIVGLNAGFYGFFARTRNALFALAVFPLHLLYFAYSVVVFAVVCGWHLLRLAFSPGSTQPRPQGVTAGDAALRRQPDLRNRLPTRQAEDVTDEG